MITQENINNFRSDGRLDVIKLANDVGLKVKPMEDINAVFSKENAFIKYENDAFTIYVNPNQSKQRQRFSIAHELGHYANHKEEIKNKGKIDRDSVNSLDKNKEEEADKYAAELLIPAEDLKAYIETNNLNGQKVITKSVVESLAERYDVSLYAMIMRLRELKFYVPYINVYA